MTRILVLIAALALAVMAGCKSPCQQLAEHLCDCSLNTVDQTNCLTAVSTSAGSTQPTNQDQDNCYALLPQPDGGGCDCRLIDTPEGKVRCGLAKPSPDDGGL